jgi:hypothetical protein
MLRKQIPVQLQERTQALANIYNGSHVISYNLWHHFPLSSQMRFTPGGVTQELYWSIMHTSKILHNEFYCTIWPKQALVFSITCLNVNVNYYRLINNNTEIFTILSQILKDVNRILKNPTKKQKSSSMCKQSTF